MGNGTIASGFRGATALGYGSESSGQNGATALGYETLSTGNSCVVVGMYNDPIAPVAQEILPFSPIFIIGNGEFQDRSNAMVVRKDGHVGIGENHPSAFLTIKGSGANSVADMAITSKDALIELGIGKEGPHGFAFGDESATGGLKLLYRSTPNQIQIESGTNFGLNDPLVVFDSLGRVGIGDSTPNDALDVVGDMHATGCVKTGHPFVSTLGGTCTSDRRLKRDIRSIGSQLHLLTALNPVIYGWKAEMNIQNEEMGLIAQEVENVIPEMVLTTEDGTKKIKYDISLQVRMIQAIKELKEENDQLRKELQEIKNLILSNRH